MKLQTLFTIIFIFIFQFLSAQPAGLNPQQWVTELSKKDPAAKASVDTLNVRLQLVDSSQTFRFLTDLEEAGKAKGYHFQARFKCIKAGAIHFKYSYYTFYQDRKPTGLDLVKRQLMELYSSAIDIAYRSEDDFLVAYVSYVYGSVNGFLWRSWTFRYVYQKRYRSL